MTDIDICMYVMAIFNILQQVGIFYGNLEYATSRLWQLGNIL
jgi:hypothetical protein